MAVPSKYRSDFGKGETCRSAERDKGELQQYVSVELSAQSMPANG
ncbi:hypothetical protein CES85_3019 (plasmid) [Ochrobactrum quorumnocens]|uniref:Uncharacterized protein n=1 Tax=Ochrobactrum quorumnocens TaxID=271865 RepID=A0A248UPN9_9HYPH|nr:hypothetical protein CES85_3019 [[Ochrobactrum] quorumnocens]